VVERQWVCASCPAVALPAKRGDCGACTVHVEGRRVPFCVTLAVMQEGKRITTIKDWSGKLRPVQAAFVEHDGFQCGFCTSGQIMSGVAMIEEAKAGWRAATADVRRPFCPADLSHAEIRERAANSAATLATPTSSPLSLKQWGRTEPCIPLRSREPMIQRSLSRLTRWSRRGVEFCLNFRKSGGARMQLFQVVTRVPSTQVRVPSTQVLYPG
jgi:aerobic-type carbon monoxide dehydrogenase small subunit (CoxS/CutS family)